MDYKRARGVIPWKPGDELPEDVIARIRGRPRRGARIRQSARRLCRFLRLSAPAMIVAKEFRLIWRMLWRSWSR